MSTQKPKILFVTGNSKKLREVQHILGDCDIEVDSMAIDLPELQGEPEEIASEKCRLAFEEARKKFGEDTPVIVEDTSLAFHALNGLPGVYIKWFLEKLGHDGLNRMLNGFEDRTAHSQCTLAFQEKHGEKPILFVGKTQGEIVQARGSTEFGWDAVFQCNEVQVEGKYQTFGEMDKELKNTISHRYRAFAQFAEFLKGRKQE
eukprot:CAMPEP_0117440034 /NCGR_PEP_ID=MMETSP0759-20121206/2868_1 /TAXON_ID=63605 /ORGANISM="Percolomonas cosmopolitus, Strain WS" /LENGTH=202 /DNA_ID=CAMNT_0005231759 /DNA_START=111 /DNA_END=719 /DNA_ORIENTATION=-